MTDQTQKHTPGPWIWKTVENGITKQHQVIVGAPTKVKDMNFDVPICLDVEAGAYNDEKPPEGMNYLDFLRAKAEANARLICLAPMVPEMVEALEAAETELLSLSETNGCWDEEDEKVKEKVSAILSKLREAQG